MSALMRIVFLVLVLSITGCASTPTTPKPSPAAPVTSASASDVAASPLGGTWVTGPIPMADIKASLVKQGLTTREVEAWVKEAGSPKQFAFELSFSGDSFTHSEETPQMAMQVGESGTFMYSGDRLTLSVGEPGNFDTYTFAIDLARDELTLQYIESTEEGTAEDKANHRRYARAFYCSSTFKHQE
jgi:uncharacterized protein YceK